MCVQARLQTAAAHVGALVRTLEAARDRWTAQFEGCVSEHIVTAAAAAALAANAEVGCSMALSKAKSTYGMTCCSLERH